MFAVIKPKKVEGMNFGTYAGVDFNNLVSVLGLGATQEDARNAAIFQAAVFNGVDSCDEVKPTDPRVNAFVELSPELERHANNAMEHKKFALNDDSEAAMLASVDFQFMAHISHFLFVGDDGKLSYAILTGDNFPYGAVMTSEEDLKAKFLAAAKEHAAKHPSYIDSFFDTF
jgi:hypothetical protein